MADRGPSAGFAGATLDLAPIAAGIRFGRIYQRRFPNPLGFGKSRSRFSDPRRRIEASRFGVLYLGSSLKVCFLEAVLRDDRDGQVGDFPMAESELDTRSHAVIEAHEPLRLLDLTGDGPVRMGIPSDVPRASGQTLARRWSVAFHDHPAAVDGLLYPSRLNGEVNVAVYDRAVHKLMAVAVTDLRRARGLATVLDDLRVALV